MTDADTLAEIKAWRVRLQPIGVENYGARNSRIALDHLDWLLARVEALEREVSQHETRVAGIQEQHAAAIVAIQGEHADYIERVETALTLSDEEAGRIVVQAFQLFVRSHGQDEPVAWSSMSIQERAIWISCAANLFADLRRRVGMTP